MNATIWHNPKCGTSRKTLAILEERPDVDVRVVRYLDEGWQRGQLEQLLKDAGLTPREALRVRGSPAEELGLTDAAVGDDTLLDAMVAHPMLVERPLVRTDKGAALCRPQEKVHALL